MKVLKGAASLLALVVMIGGVPVALTVLGGNPLPDHLGAGEIWRALSQPASDRLLVGFLTIIGWVAWALFTVSVLVEVINLASGYRIRIRIPGLRIGQQFTAGLIIAVIAMLGAAQLAGTLSHRSSDPAPAAAPPATVATTAGPTSHHAAPAALPDDGPSPARAELARPAETTAAAPAGTPVESRPDNNASRQRVHVVQEGDFLWTLAQRYLGYGTEWHRIVEANGLTSTTLHPGQRLTIPVDHTGHDDGTITVRAGDSLSALAQQLWGDPDRWPELWQANRAQVPDPDQLAIGQVLTIPTTDTQDQQHTKKNQKNQNDEKNQKDQESQKDQSSEKDRDSDRGGQDQTESPERDQSAQRPGRDTDQPPARFETVTAHTAATGSDAAQVAEEQIAAAAASVGLLLATGLVATLAVRRRRQLAARRPGQAPASPAEPALALESRVRRVEEPLTIAQLDQALRSIAAHAAAGGGELPELVAARIGDSQIHLLHRAPAVGPPPGVSLAADGSVWVIDHADLPLLLSAGSLATIAHPWPALVTLGRTSDEAHVLLNLEAVGALSISADTDDQVRRAITTLAAELTVSPWSSELTITLVGTGADLAAAVGHPRVRHIDDLDQALAELERTAAEQRPYLDTEGATVGSKRLDVNLADAWAPHLLLVADAMDAEQTGRVADLVTTLPRVAVAAATAAEVPQAWRYRLGGDPLAGQLTVALHDELEWDLVPTMLSDEDLVHMADLIGSTADTKFEPAPWWHAADEQPEPAPESDTAETELDETELNDDAEPDEDEPAASQEPAAPHVTTHTLPAAATSRRRRPLRHALLELAGDTAPEDTEPPASPDEPADNPAAAADETHEDELREDGAPLLQIFGPPEIIGAAGERNQNPGRCMEILLALLERPGRTNRQIADALALSPATTRSVITYLRAWLGAAPDGMKWLPDANPGRGGYRADDRVTSDWHRAQLLVGRGGINHASPAVLQQVLGMVRGKPLEGTVDWSSVDHLKSQISAFLEEASHLLTSHALDQGDLRLARWSNGQGLLADPESERLLTDKIVIANRAGDHDEVQRLVGKVSANARALELDLSDDTQDVLTALARS